MHVRTMLQDRQGFIWLGTDQGLFRFDGRGFTHYTKSDSLPDNRVTALAQDSLGRIWIGHGNGIISILSDTGIRRFETREGSAVEAVSDILFDREGVMWFSTRNDGLYYYTNERLYRIDEDEGLPDLYVYDLFEDDDGNIWAGTDAGVAICSLSDGQVNVRVIDSDEGLPDIIVRKISALESNVLGFATEDEGLISYNILTGEVKTLNPGWQSGPISDFVVKENQVWIAAPRKGLMVLEPETSRLKTYGRFDALNLLSIEDLLLDREGNIWSGMKSGLILTTGDAVEHIDLRQVGANQNVLATAVDAQDRIWFSTGEGLFVRKVDPQGIAVVTKALQNTGLSRVPVISLYVDPYDFVWAGLYGEGVVRLDPKGNVVANFNTELRNGNILSITGKGDSVWMATLAGTSLVEIRNNSYEIKNFSSADGLSSDFIYQVVVDSRGRTWFATDGKGVTMLDKQGFHHFREGLPSQVVYSVTEDSEGNIWASSQDNGIFLLQGNQFVSVPEVRLRENSVQALRSDRYGNLIAFHNFGIDVYDVRRKQMRYWGEESGIRDKEPNLNAVGVDRFGDFFAGMSKGIVRFSLRNDLSITSPEAAIDDFKVFGQSINFSRPPELRHNENNITIHFLGVWFHNASNLNYLYKLDNYDVEWIATKNEEVTYSRLPAGSYTFRVKVSDTDDFSNARETSVSFTVQPPFWRTAGFYILVIAVTLIFGYGIVRYRERRLLRDKLILETKVEQRTREIQLKTEEIQAQNEEIMAQAEEIQGINENLEMLVQQRTAELEKKNKALEEYAFINAHKLRSPVASILGLVNLLAKAEPGEDTTIIREHLQQSADKLDEVVRSITKAIERADNDYL